MIPRSVTRLLEERLTNIVAYELIAAILAVILADSLFPDNVKAFYRFKAGPRVHP